jgi:hypothetical protein
MGWTIRGSSRGRGKKFSTSPKCAERFWGLPSLLFNGYQRCFPGVRHLRPVADHLLPSSAEVKNGWSSSSTCPIHPHSLDRDNIAFVRLWVKSIHVRYFLYGIWIQFLTVDITSSSSMPTVPVLFMSSHFLLTLCRLFLAYRTASKCATCSRCSRYSI